MSVSVRGCPHTEGSKVSLPESPLSLAGSPAIPTNPPPSLPSGPAPSGLPSLSLCSSRRHRHFPSHGRLQHARWSYLRNLHGLREDSGSCCRRQAARRLGRADGGAPVARRIFQRGFRPRRPCPSCPGRRRLRAGRPRAADTGRSARALLARTASIICQHLSCSRIFPRYTASRVIPAEGPPSIPRWATTLERPGPAESVFTSPHLIIYL